MRTRFDYRHILCIIITLGFLACGVFLFSNAFGRLIEAGRDFGLSTAFWFCELFGIEYGFTPTVNDLPQIPLFPFLGGQTPVTSLPETWTGFQSNLGIYWGLWVNLDNFTGYLSLLVNVLFSVCMVALIIAPFVLVLRWAFGRYLKRENNDYDKDSKPLKVFKWLAYHTYRPVKIWLVGFITFVRERKGYWVTWLCMWLCYFNAFTIILEFLAFYLYFVMSFDVLNIYRQVYKLCLDLWTVFSFVPVWAWAIIGIVVLHIISLRIGYDRLNHRERCNRGFINERGVVNEITGYVGSGKTTLASDIALSCEVQILDEMFEVILETDMHFPNFPWINLENELRRAAYFHVIYDKWSIRRWLRKKYARWVKSPCREKLFNYDYDRYGLTYDNKLEIIDIWKALENYACAYYIYTVQSSYIIANYGIRSDKLMMDIGNFPLWNTDFFKRDSRLIDSFSRHSHILDFDMLRLGKKMLEKNPNRNAFGFGVYVVSEIDKERKNAPELQEVKRNSDDCNQKNDLFNACLKMSRHSCIVANRVPLFIIGDLQRSGSLNSDMLELGDLIEVYDKGDMSPVLPFFSPFWVIDLLMSLVFGKFINVYTQYRFTRSDNTLFMYIVKGICAKLSNYRERINNVFGSQTVKLHVERGLKDGKVKDCKWYCQSKKIYSKRFSTDCLSGIFEARGALNTVGIDDLVEYADIMARNDELQRQHSHAQNEFARYAV